MLNLHKECQKVLNIKKQKYHFYSLRYIEEHIGNFDHLPKTIKILLENILRCQKHNFYTKNDIKEIVTWKGNQKLNREIFYQPTRVLMQDFTGIPAIVDLAAMRETVQKLGGKINKINPILPVDLIIDHSINVEYFGNEKAFKKNMQLEMKKNYERYSFLRWGQESFNNFRVVPPGTGICHQINLEYLGKIIWKEKIKEKQFIWPDTLVGTDSHTTMINSMGILGWGVGGLEAEAAMLGQPISMLIPDVVGFKLTGKMNSKTTATDLVLTITQILRQHNVVGKFVEFYGDGLKELSLPDRATISNMSPEYGATCGFFPIDEITLDYMLLTGRDPEEIALIEIYAKEQKLWRYPGDEPVFSSKLQLNMNDVESSLAGPKRPQDRVSIKNVAKVFDIYHSELKVKNSYQIPRKTIFPKKNIKNLNFDLQDGAVVISAITSCTNTSNPNVLIAAGLLAKKAVKLGLKKKPWVKTSLAPGSKVVSQYLSFSKLTPYLNELGFNLVGYGCTTCIGNSGSLNSNVEFIIKQKNLVVSAVLSGNRNFEGRIHPLVKTNWLASPPLVVAYALIGNIKINFEIEAIGEDKTGRKIYLKDIWPTKKEILTETKKITSDMFKKEYQKVFLGEPEWKNIQVNKNLTYEWDKNSTYIQIPPFFKKLERFPKKINDIENARILAIFGDSVTTDHISPAGTIKKNSPAGKYLLKKGVKYKDFNSYGSRRGNHEIMVRGTFANIRIRNEILDKIEGGFTRYFPSEKQLTIYDAAIKYKKDGIPLVIIAGKEYGSGSSRDWAAKGPNLLGINVVISESFERIHRSNLIAVGILPLEFLHGITRKTLNLTGREQISIKNLHKIKPHSILEVKLIRENGKQENFETKSRIDTNHELEYYRNGGILHYMIRKMLD